MTRSSISVLVSPAEKSAKHLASGAGQGFVLESDFGKSAPDQWSQSASQEQPGPMVEAHYGR